MRLTDIAHKELVDMDEGTFWGPVGKADLLIDELNGRIDSLLVSGRYGFLSMSQSDEIVIPWSSIIKIGKDVIILKLGLTNK